MEQTEICNDATVFDFLLCLVLADKGRRHRILEPDMKLLIPGLQPNFS